MLRNRLSFYQDSQSARVVGTRWCVLLSYRKGTCARVSFGTYRVSASVTVVQSGLLHGEHLLPQRGGKQERRAHYQATDSEPCDLGPREDVRKVGREGNVRGRWRMRGCLVALLR